MPTGFLASIYAKLLGAALLLAALFGLWLWGDLHGAARVQAQWQVAKDQASAAAANQRAASAVQTLDWTRKFASIATHYEATSHEAVPNPADALPAAVADGTVRLRDQALTTCPANGAVSRATAAARVRDAAATQALADRVANSIAAVRAGADADQREYDFRQQVIALRLLLQAERQQSPTP